MLQITHGFDFIKLDSWTLTAVHGVNSAFAFVEGSHVVVTRMIQASGEEELALVILI